MKWVGSPTAMGQDALLESFHIQRSSVWPPEMASLPGCECRSCRAGSSYVEFCVAKLGLGFAGLWKLASRFAFGGRGSPEAVRISGSWGSGRHSCRGLPTLALTLWHAALHPLWSSTSTAHRVSRPWVEKGDGNFQGFEASPARSRTHLRGIAGCKSELCKCSHRDLCAVSVWVR